MSAILIAAGPISTWFIASERFAPGWIAAAIGMVVTIWGIDILGGLMRHASQR